MDWISFSVVIAIIIVVSLYKGVRQAKETANKAKSVMKDNRPLNPFVGTEFEMGGIKSLAINLINKMGLQYELQEDGDCIVTYQGEKLRFEFFEQVPIIIRITDIWWHEVSTTDIDNLALVQRTINECNLISLNKFFYCYDDNHETMGVNTIRELYLTPDISNIETYFQISLDYIIRGHHQFYSMIERCRQEQCVTK